ncbi:GNAT family N-acetyltransferase [Jiangella asiatica]|uniref:GNAT family N-acetyltransferase n=1 Tax=Jiangella asiatica TaxID=2530372 RepID=UPI0013A5CF49|nr:GNAT family N-acetyltransferase [Jiangella asiatica]
MSRSAETRTVDGFLIRRATVEDLDGAGKVIRRVLDEDLGGYRPDIHWDLERLEETYIKQSRYCLVVAIDQATGAVAGTSAVRPGGPWSPPHPEWLAARYHPERTAQLFRVYIDPDYRRHGLARALVNNARDFVANEGGYDVIYLHTDPRSPGAEPFWRSMPTVEIYDARKDPGPNGALHFHMAFPDGSYGNAWTADHD